MPPLLPRRYVRYINFLTFDILVSNIIFSVLFEGVLAMWFLIGYNYLKHYQSIHQGIKVEVVRKM